MELKIFQNKVTGYGGRWETRVELPVETEILIPDYLPAVFKIVKCLMEPVVLQNRVAAGRWQTEGYLRCTVYYQSDEPGCKLWRIEQKFAFEKSIELPAAGYAPGPARLWGESEYCNCRAVSEHRIDLRGAYILFASLLLTQETELLTSLADCGIEQRADTLHGLQRVAAEEKTYTAESTTALPAPDETMLDITGRFVPEQVSCQTGQVSVKGVLQLQLCSRSGETDTMGVRRAEVPVQQVLELPGTAPDNLCLCWGEVMACTLSAEDAAREARLSVTWKLHAELWRESNYEVVADAYSTLCHTQTVATGCKLLQKSAAFEDLLTVEVEDDLPDADCTVQGCFVTLGQAVALPQPEQEGNIVLQGKGVAHVICADARGELTCYDKPFVWQPQGSWPGCPADACVSVQATAARVQSSKNGARLHVEVQLALSGMLLQAVEQQALCGVELGEMFADPNDGPALYLYYAAKGERVFDIAKRYHARPKDLAAANALNEGENPTVIGQDCCLLIPAAL